MEQQRAQQQAQRPKEGVHVDFIPKKSAEKIKKDIEGGEYVDYEEVKD
jgi:anti-sigma28 factor (negative regulator of flagellin synthesis)